MNKGIWLCGLVIGLPQLVMAETPQGIVECHVTTDGKTQVHEALNGRPVSLKADLKTPRTYNMAYFHRLCRDEHGPDAEAKIAKM